MRGLASSNRAQKSRSLRRWVSETLGRVRQMDRSAKSARSAKSGMPFRMQGRAASKCTSSASLCSLRVATLHSGFGGLKFTVTTDIPPELREELADAKADAVRTNAEVTIERSGMAFAARRSGGMSKLISGIVERLPDKWTTGLYLPDFEEPAELPDKMQSEPFDRLTTQISGASAPDFPSIYED
jgi:hypothetical protein